MEKEECAFCCGDGYTTSGHYDQFSAPCRYCEGTGIKKFDRCRNCNKFGEIDDKEKPLAIGGYARKKCPICKGKRVLEFSKK